MDTPITTGITGPYATVQLDFKNESYPAAFFPIDVLCLVTLHSCNGLCHCQFMKVACLLPSHERFCFYVEVATNNLESLHDYLYNSPTVCVSNRAITTAGSFCVYRSSNNVTIKEFLNSHNPLSELTALAEVMRAKPPYIPLAHREDGPYPVHIQVPFTDKHLFPDNTSDDSNP